VDEFKETMRWSQRADEEYAAWLRSWNSQYREKKRHGCDVPFRGHAWKVFHDLNQSAKAHKRGFLKLYNEVAGKYDLRQWKAFEF
jgi:hypothetical protein